MFAAGQKDMQQMDHYTIEKIGLPGVVLMENAGAKVVEEILAYSQQENTKVVVLAGGGNNGGDGVVIARKLFESGLDSLLCLLVNPTRIHGDAKVNLNVYINRGLPVFYLHENSLQALRLKLDQADIIIDAILGTGVNGPVRAPLDQVISLVNEFQDNKFIISVDIPSGVSCDSGKVAGMAVHATETITFVFPKKGFFLNEGPQYVGEWKAVDISVPQSIVKQLGLEMPELITDQFARSCVPVRPRYGHKGTFGHALILGGSRNYIGAPIYAAKAALHSGAGLVTLAVPESIYPMVSAQNPESLFLPLSESQGHFAGKAIAEIAPKLSQFDSIAIGPGMSRFMGGEGWMKSLFDSLSNQPVVVDADALFLLRNELNMIRNYKGNVIFTPHPGEMSRLVNQTVQEVEAQRIEVASTFAKEYNVYLLLKGHRSIIADPNGGVYINPYGHDALGKGGSGDVLTGLITSFLAQGASPLNALISASYLHAKAGEEKSRIKSHYGVMPFDLIDGVKDLLIQ